MRVLHVCHQYHPAVGGAERYVTELSEELAARGHQVDVFTTRSTDYMTWKSSLPAHERIRCAQVHRFAALPRRRHTWHVLDFGLQGYARTHRSFFEPFVFYGNGPISPALAMALLRRIRKYSLVHIVSLHYAHAWTTFMAAKVQNVPVALTPLVHIDQPETYDVGYMKRMLRESEMVFAVTDAERRMLAERELANDVMVTGSGLRVEDFPPIDKSSARAHFGLPDDAFVALFLGRKTAYKGLETSVQAVAGLRHQRSNTFLLAAGPETEYSRQLWTRHAGMKGLVVRGELSNADRLAALAACDVLVLPSSAESFGIVFLEAWAYAKPVIGGNIEAVASLIDDGVNGFLVDVQDPSALAQRMALLAAQPELAARLGENGRRKLGNRYTWQRIGDIVEGAYARVLRRHANVKGAPLCA